MLLAVELGVAGFTLHTTVSTATFRDDQQSGLPSRDDGGRDSALFRSPRAMTFIDHDHVVVVDGLSGRLPLVMAWPAPRRR